MKPKFYTQADNLVFELNKQKEVFKFPHPIKELAKVPQFIDDLNRRIAKHKNITADKISVNSHNVFIEVATDVQVRVKFPTMKLKSVGISQDVHEMLRTQSLQAGLSASDYLRLVLVQCKSDKNV